MKQRLEEQNNYKCSLVVCVVGLHVTRAPGLVSWWNITTTPHVLRACVVGTINNYTFIIYSLRRGGLRYRVRV